MRLSEYISILEDIKATHGDLTCLSLNDCSGRWMIPEAEVETSFDTLMELDDLPADVEAPEGSFVSLS